MTKIYEEIPATHLKITKIIALYCCSFEYLSYFVYTPLDSPCNNRQNRYRRTDYTDAAEFFFSVFIFERPNLISIATDVDCASIYAILLQIFMQKGLLPLTSSLSSFSVCRLSGRYVRCRATSTVRPFAEVLGRYRLARSISLGTQPECKAKCQ